MDRFYLENAALFQDLVKKFSIPLSKEAKMTNTPAMIVGARIRPLSEEDQNTGYPCATFQRQGEPNTIDIHNLYNHPRGRPILKSSSYEVDKVFDSFATTEEIYNSFVVDLVPFARQGGVGTLFSYGQTGSGKTFTVSRLQQLIAASLMDEPSSSQIKIHLTIIDLAGNSASDLLDSRKPVSILEDSIGNAQWAGATECEVHSKEDMMDLIERAVAFRRTESTQKNDVSSRSHGICRIRIFDPARNSEGLIYLVDLAGSEVARDSATHLPERMRETREINMSLSVLKDCIRAKAELEVLKASDDGKLKQRLPHIPFRQSVLTKVLKHVFDPTGRRARKTIVIACLNPSLADVGATKNTLRYAEMLRVLVPICNSGQNLKSESREVLFANRIRPGMVISWRQFSSKNKASSHQDELNLAVILCPTYAVRAELEDASGQGMTKEGRGGNETKYLCALFFKSDTIDAAYELNLWQQKVIDISMMDREVILEYNGIDRYYRVRD